MHLKHQNWILLFQVCNINQADVLHVHYNHNSFTIDDNEHVKYTG